MGGIRTEILAEKYNIHSHATQKEHLQFWQNTVQQKHPHIKIDTLEDLTNIPHKIISKTIKQIQTEQIEKNNVQEWKSQIAPAKMIIKDFKETAKRNPTIFLSTEMAQAFYIRAIEGHAQNGDGQFQAKTKNLSYLSSDPYPNTTTKNTLEAIEKIGLKEFGKQLTKNKFQTKSQQGNDNIVQYLEDWFIDIEKNISLVNTKSRFAKLKKDKKPLNRMTCFKGTEVDMLELARGFYLVANMDDFKGTRIDGFKKYSYQVGGGECHLTSTEKLQKYGININNLSKATYHNSFTIFNHISNEKRLDVLEDLGIIKRKTLPLEQITEGEFTWNEIKRHPATTDLLKNSEYWGHYIRDTKGEGIGDDLVIWLAGFLPPTIYKNEHKESRIAIQSRIIGGLLADQMDTMEKDAKLFIPGGQDKIAAQHINGHFRKLARNKKFRKKFNIKGRMDAQYNLVNHDEIVDYTMAGANTLEQHIHSSQRWFYKKINNTCALTEYMKYAYFCARAENKEMYLSDLKNFKVDPEQNPSKTKFTFRQISLKQIQQTMKKRLQLVIDPEKREERLRSYYSPN